MVPPGGDVAHLQVVCAVDQQRVHGAGTSRCGTQRFLTFSTRATKTTGVIDCDKLGVIDYFLSRKFVENYILRARHFIR